MPLFDDTPDPAEEKLFQAALRYLAIRPRSIKEMTDYLTRKSADPAWIPRIIDRLKQYRYLDDEVFARIFIENRKRNHPKSRFALTHELKQKGISARIIESQLASCDDIQMACKALSARIRHWRHLDPEVRQKKRSIICATGDSGMKRFNPPGKRSGQTRLRTKNGPVLSSETRSWLLCRQNTDFSGCFQIQISVCQVCHVGMGQSPYPDKWSCPFQFSG